MSVFIHDHVWVNDGTPSSLSDEQRALAAGSQAAFIAKHPAWHRPRNVLIESMPCTDDHIEYCYHARVTLTASEV